MAELGIPMTESNRKWYGEPPEQERSRYFSRARSLGLDEDVAEDTGESLTIRLWRRYGQNAFKMLDMISLDSSMAQPAIVGTGLRRCEIGHLRDQEMVVHLEDLLRRRSRLALLYRAEELEQLPGLRETCGEIFGDQAEEKMAACFHTPDLQA